MEYWVSEKGNQTTRAIPYHKKPAETFSVCEMPSFKGATSFMLSISLRGNLLLLILSFSQGKVGEEEI